jgi:predicted kinase
MNNGNSSYIHKMSMSMPDLGASIPASAASSAPTSNGVGQNNSRQPPPLMVDNPMPHRLPEGENAAPLEVIGTTASDKLIIIMVGLPATGKTHIAKRICRFLSFFHDIPSQIFNVGDYRRQLCGANMPAEFYDPNNIDGAEQRHMACDAALADLVEYVKKDGVRVAAFDATNSTKDRRQHILNVLKNAGLGAKKMFVESVCDQDEVSG